MTPDQHQLMQAIADRAAQPTKGTTYGGPCNLTACQKPGATYWNKSTETWYCEECAREINYWAVADCLQLYGTPDLCEHVTPEELNQQKSEAELKEACERAARELARVPRYICDTTPPTIEHNTNRYAPHQGAREMQRRAKRMEKDDAA